MGVLPVLLKKELRGSLRTYRLLIVLALFVLLGLGTPLMLKYLHVLVPADEAGIVLPEFSAVDVVGEYLNSVGQFGLIIAVLVAMGSVAREREWGTAAMVLSKPVGTGSFLLAKLAALGLVFLAALAVGGIGCYAYTLVLFGDISAWGFALGSLLVGLYLLVCIAVTLMCSCFFKNQLAVGALALVLLIALTALSALPSVGDYLPGALTSWAYRAVSGSEPNTWGALGVSLAVVPLAIAVGWQAFRRKEL